MKSYPILINIKKLPKFLEIKKHKYKNKKIYYLDYLCIILILIIIGFMVYFKNKKNNKNMKSLLIKLQQIKNLNYKYFNKNNNE